MKKILTTKEGFMILGKYIPDENSLLSPSYKIEYLEERIQNKLNEKIVQYCKENGKKLPKWNDSWTSEERWITFYLSDEGEGIINVEVTLALNWNYGQEEVVVNLDVHLFEQDLPEVIAMLSNDLFKSIFGKVITIHNT